MAVGHITVDDLEEGRLEGLGDRAPPARANRDLVDGSDGRNLDRRACEERLVADVQHLAREYLFPHAEPEIVRDGENRVARDARQDRGAQRRRVNRVVADDEQVLSAAFADMPGRVERDPFAVAVRDRLHLDQLRVRVVRGALRERREGVGRRPRPGADPDVHAVLQRVLPEIRPPLPREDRGVDRAGKRVDAERVIPAIDDRPDVAGLERVRPDGLEHRVGECHHVDLRFHPVDLAGVEQAAHVRVEPETGGAPRRVVATRSFENAAPVMNDVGSDVNRGVRPVDERTVHPDLAGAGESHR